MEVQQLTDTDDLFLKICKKLTIDNKTLSENEAVLFYLYVGNLWKVQQISTEDFSSLSNRLIEFTDHKSDFANVLRCTMELSYYIHNVDKNNASTTLGSFVPIILDFINRKSTT